MKPENRRPVSPEAGPPPVLHASAQRPVEVSLAPAPRRSNLNPPPLFPDAQTSASYGFAPWRRGVAAVFRRAPNRGDKTRQNTTEYDKRLGKTAVEPEIHKRYSAFNLLSCS